MKKGRSYQQNPIQNFEIEQQFQQLMQIEGLSTNKQQRKELFPSIKHLFHSNTTVNIVGQGPNANVRSFYYLLLCHIRKEHFKRLLNEMREKELLQIQGDEQMVGRRDRKVSFNGKGAIFLNGPQYQNYGLHKLRMFIFSKSVDLLDIQNTPFEKDERLRYGGQQLTSSMLKKLFSEFLKELLPVQLSKNYKSQIRSIRSYLNQHMCIGVILTILMRHILFSRYEVQSAREYEEEINDHTVCTTLCDAFAIDGLICKDHLYEINTWCKVYSLDYCSNKTFFIEMFNDEFEEMGSANDKKTAAKIGRSNDAKTKISQDTEQKEAKALLRYPSSKLSIPKSERSGPIIKSKGSSSVMDADAESEVSDETGRKSKKVGMKFRAAKSGQQSFSQVLSQFNSSICRSTAKDNRQCSSQMNGSTRNGQQESVRLKQVNDCKPSTHIQLEQVLNHQKKDERGINAQVSGQESILLKDNAPIVHTNPQLLFGERIPQQQVDAGTSFSKKRSEYRGNFDDGEHTPSDFFQKLNIVYDKNNFKVKIGYRQERQGQPSIVNNNINNNIYLNFAGNDSKALPIINISTAKDLKTNIDPNSYIKINLS